MATKNINTQKKSIKLYALEPKRSIDLSLSENPLGCSPLVAQRLRQNNISFNSYPAPNGISLKKALAEKFDCSEKNVFVSNGSEAIIHAIPRVLANPGDEAIVPSLTFPMFDICSNSAGLDVKLAPADQQLGIDLSAILNLVNKKTKLIFICNPNNPTGSTLRRVELIKFVAKIPESILIVIDEANIEFGGESLIDLATKRSNVIVLRTFSKGFGLANLRIGFAVGDQKLIMKLKAETPVFPISGFSEELAVSTLLDDRFIRSTKEFIEAQRKIIQIELEKLGFQVFPSQANNLFVKLPDSLPARTFWKKLELADISLVRGSSFAGFDDRFFRVSPRLEKINQKFLEEVKKIVEE